MVRTRCFAVAGLSLVAACGTSSLPVDPGGDSEFKSEVNLAPLLPPSADLVGFTVAPEGQRYVLDRNSGLYEVDASGARLVFVGPTPTTETELTDVVALGSERFAVTAENDGFLIDLHNHTFTSYFCYLPGSPISQPDGPVVIPSVSQTLRSQGIEVKERTESVAFSPVSLQLFAQPQTIRLDDGAIMGSELFLFTDGGGQPIQVITMPSTSFLAGGMVAMPDLRLMLGVGNQLHQVDQSGAVTLVRQFEAPIDISGLALDADGDLLMLDRTGRRLLEVSLN